MRLCRGTHHGAHETLILVGHHCAASVYHRGCSDACAGAHVDAVGGEGNQRSRTGGLVIDESDGGGGVVQQHGAYRVGCVEHSSVGVHVDDHAGGVQRRRLFQASGDLPDRRGHDVFAYGQEIDRRAGIRGGFFPGGYLRPADRYSRGKEQEVEQYCRTELVHGRMVLDGCPHRRTFRLQI